MKITMKKQGLLEICVLKKKGDFSVHPHAKLLAENAARDIEPFLSIEDAVFLGRIGSGTMRASRSVRLPLEDLWVG